ncbi:MAG: class I SAM-dependent methyltransferase [Mesorhizobium sp.]
MRRSTEMELGHEFDALFGDQKQLARVRAEAEFGESEIHSFLDALAPGARILEVGCGTGYLLARFAKDYPHLHFDGLEPIGSGFAQFEPVLDAVSAALVNVQIFKNPIETYTSTDDHYDLIFSINVFEHLGDWRQGIDAAVRLLNEAGSLVFLCPNYTFPYEPHFGIPLLGSKASRLVFSRRIERVERDTDSFGLWNSLNFITAFAVKRHCVRNGYKVVLDQAITGRMVGRLSTDGEFAARQGLLGKLLASSFSPTRIFAFLPSSILPYMKVIVSKR